MKLLNSLLLSVITAGVVFADPPKTHSASRYRELYLSSPMTDPPLPPEKEEGPPSDLPDWVLVGLTKYVDKTEIEIMNKKDRSRVKIPSVEASEMGFRVKSVVQDRNYLDDSVVILQKGKDTGEVRFDPKFLVLKKVAGAPARTPARTANQQRSGTTQNRRTTQGRTPPVPGRTNTGRTRGTTTNGTSRSNIPRPTSVPRPGATTNSTNSSRSTTTTNSNNSSSSTSGRRQRYIGGNR